MSLRISVSLTSSFLSACVGFGTLLSGSAAFAQKNVCNLVFNSGAPASPALLSDWRQASTHTLANGDLAKTSATREAWLKNAAKWMDDFMFDRQNNMNHPDIPEIVFAAEEGVTTIAPSVAILNKAANTIPLNYTADPAQQGFHYDQIPRIQVTGLTTTSGVLKGTLLLPVSTHVGLDNAAKWKDTDTYRIDLTSSGVTKTVVSNARSLGYLTAHEIEIPMTKGVPSVITYHRSGSGGPSGYSDGRTIEIVWDGN